MRYVIIRDDDTNALTPPEFLEQLYRPLLDRGLPINLATVPEVTTDARMANGQPEGFLLAWLNMDGTANGNPAKGLGVDCFESFESPASESLSTPNNGTTLPITRNQKLLRYLHENPGYH